MNREHAVKIANTAIEALEDKKGEDIRIIDISEVSVMADFFIICSGGSANQVQALVDNVTEKLHDIDVHPRQEGYRAANWILLDCGDVIIHVFDRENRLFYDLERIWRDGKRITREELS